MKKQNNNNGTTPLILLYSDNPSPDRLLPKIMKSEGFQVINVRDSEAVLSYPKKSGQPVLALLEDDPVDHLGTQMCRQPREHSWLPVVIMGPSCNVDDTVTGLEAGADDYIGKPLSTNEFIFRVKAVLRRCGFPVQFNQSPLSSGSETTLAW